MELQALETWRYHRKNCSAISNRLLVSVRVC